MSDQRLLKFKDNTQSSAGQIRSVCGLFGHWHVILYSNGICPFLQCGAEECKVKNPDYGE